MFLKIIVILLISCEMCHSYTDETKILKKMTLTFGTQVWACKNEIEFGQDLINDFHNFWDANFTLDNPKLGCVFYCVFEKLELVGEGDEINEANAVAFGVANGSDKITSHALIELYKMCKIISKSKEPCVLGLTLARCIRAGVLQMKWSPDKYYPGTDDDVLY